MSTSSIRGATAILRRIGVPTTPTRRLFCMPYAGGGAAAFRLWRPALADDIDLMALQLPGRESSFRERPFASIAEIVEASLPALVDAADLPYAIFGHSMGALVAFELAVALERAVGRAPTCLFVSARRSPEEPDQRPPMSDLPEPEFLDEIQRRYGAIPEAIRQEPELLAHLLPVLRTDIRAIEHYVPLTARKVRCPVHVYGGIDDQHPLPAQLARWQRVAERDVRVRFFAGGHFYLNTQLDVLAADIASHLPDESTSGALV